MRPASLLGILLDLIAELSDPGALPADARVGKFFRARRYLGSHDRRWISSAAYGWLRHGLRGEARWDAWAGAVGLPPCGSMAPRGSLDARSAPLGPLLALAHDGLFPWSLGEVMEAAQSLQPPLGAPYTDILARAASADGLGDDAWPADPISRAAAELSLPRWLWERLASERGEEDARRLAAALLLEAPVDLRVNLAQVSRDAARAALEREAGPGQVEATPWSPTGLRIRARKNLGHFMSLHPDWIEVQDEGSQVAALSCEVRPGEVVIDACAGAGGKTVALIDIAAAAGGDEKKGGIEIHALDTDPRKLEELLRRIGGRKARCIAGAIDPEGPLPAELRRGADLVVVDAPCSGTGTLRRNPELKRRHGSEEIARLSALQGSILTRFAPLVRPGGRLAYITCSLLAEENEAVVEKFLSEFGDFQAELPEWAKAHLPPAAQRGPFVVLDPVVTGTDGFFVAILRRHPPRRETVRQDS